MDNQQTNNTRDRGRGRGTGNRGNRGGDSNRSNYNRRRSDNNYNGRQQENATWFQRGRGGWQPSNHNANQNRNDTHEPGNVPRGKYQPRQMGYKALQSILEINDVEAITLELNNSNKGFSLLLDSNDIKSDVIVLVVKLLRVVCDCSFQSTSIETLQNALRSNFMKNLISYISGIVSHSAHEKKFNRHFWDDPDDFWENIIHISKFVHSTIPTYCEEIRKLLKSIEIFIPNIEAEHSMHISDDIKVKITSLITVIDETLKDLERKKEIKKIVCEEDEGEPPDDYREIPVIPCALEVTTRGYTFLRKNVIQGEYRDVHHYLDIQFRLLREDFVAPLRDGICSYISDPKAKLDDIRIYKSVRFLGPENANEQDCYKIQINLSNRKVNYRSFENSKRFMFGSLILFTSDNFKTLLFAKIVNRDLNLLDKGQLVIGFYEEIEVNLEVDYLMVESKVYFEPYYQVLNVLKQVSHQNFPMEKYLLKVEKDCDPPQYLLTIDPKFYEIEGTRFWPLNWPQQNFYNLNEAQLEAFKAALTKEFVIIQGPPGTGKTFLGLKIAHTLLNNSEVWYRKSPILVICYTNHALDQFLEGLLPVTDQIVRVGGQSKNEKLAKFNLNSKRKFGNRVVYQYRDEVRDCSIMIQFIIKQLDEIETNDSVISFNNFGFIREFQGSWFHDADENKIREWLLGGAAMPKPTRRPIPQAALEDVQMPDEVGEFDNAQDNAVEIDDVLNDVSTNEKDKRNASIFNLKEIRDKMALLERDLGILYNTPMSEIDRSIRQDQIYMELDTLYQQLTYLEYRLGQGRHGAARPDYVDLQHPHNMTADDRWSLYFSWLNKYERHLRDQHTEKTEKYKTAYKLYSDMRDMEDVQMMKEQHVVGMTTTGAARLQESLQALKSPIVIVEEAAEVLEAHIVAALTKHCAHLILIGDHQQLKPSTANYRIETKFQLGISLFERMVLNEIECHTLNIQHRMRPEISRLITPTIYPVLADHQTTLDRDPIKGITKSVYFVDHEEQEQLCSDTSKKNEHEAKFVVALARHLILNGYEPEDVTILPAYLGQMFEIKRRIRQPENKLLLENVKVAVLDNYQGEESKIILLSLVRSNAEGKVGFLKLENRVCVALSRARDGLYILGNMKLLCDNTEIWPKVKQTLEEQESIGPYLSLRCQIHRHKITNVRRAEDFNKISEGGCDEKCNFGLACGHRCTNLCHVRDREHNNYKCLEKCNKLLCDDPFHICAKHCYEECGPCTYPVQRDLPCGHHVTLQCHIDPLTHNCSVLIKDVKLPCGHITDKPCSADVETYLCPFPCDVRVEPCGHQCKKKCHVRNDPDHIKYKCPRECTKQRVGCQDPENPDHRCPRVCWQDCEECVLSVRKARTVCPHYYDIACKLNVDEIECKKPCKETLPCGHNCKSLCCEPCGPCQILVEKFVSGCNHKIKIKCCEEPDRWDCYGKCPLLLSCGHICKNKCNEKCTTSCLEIVKCDIPTPCGHRATEIKCFLKNTDLSDNPDVLLKVCNEPCGAELKCGHTCRGTCGQCFQGRVHVKCLEKCGVPQVCGHECDMPCREACKPCERKCDYRCKHSKCSKKCGEPCTPCSQRCSRQCQHQACNRKCGQICNVPPCKEPCQKKLSCGHPCQGFCGDPCPRLCKECESEKFQELLDSYATEDEEGARLVYLADCKHIVVGEGMDKWLQADGDAIKAKECPQCRTPLATTARYSDYVKQALRDVFNVKRKFYGREKDNEMSSRDLVTRIHLTQRELVIRNGYPQLLRREVSKALQLLSNRLESTSRNRRQTVNASEIAAIESKYQVLNGLLPICKESTIENKTEKHITFLVEILMRVVDHTTAQELDDLQNEMSRLNRMVQYDGITKGLDLENYAAAKPLADQVREIIDHRGKFTKEMDAWAQPLLEQLKQKVGCTLDLTEAEKIAIVAAVGVKKGAWFKCPNGHPYAIGDCGGAMQESKCIECQAPIGGGQHRLLDGQRFAPDMDNAAAPAWPGVHY